MKQRFGWSYAIVMTIAAVTQGCQGDADEMGMDDAEAIAPTEGAAASGSSSGALSAGGSKGACIGQSGAEDTQQGIAAASVAQIGQSSELVLCAGRDQYYRVRVPAHRIVRVGIETRLADGDLDLVAYDDHGKLLGARAGAEYPYTGRSQETDEEYLSFYAANSNAEYYVRVADHGGKGGSFRLHVDQYVYADGATCEGAGFSFADCVGEGAGGKNLLPFPFPDPKDAALGDAYDFASFSNYRFARRELVMLVRHALAETRKAFPGTGKLSLVDICQRNGITPGYDIGQPRHPASTHDQGGNIDIAYFQTDGSNDAEIICGDGSTHEDGYCSASAATTNIVDLPREAFFMAQLFASPRTRVVGVDQVLAPLLQSAAEALAARPAGDPARISAASLSGFSAKMASGAGWPYHHHHIHLSMKWWGSAAYGDDAAFGLPQMAMPGYPQVP